MKETKSDKKVRLDIEKFTQNDNKETNNSRKETLREKNQKDMI